VSLRPVSWWLLLLACAALTQVECVGSPRLVNTVPDAGSPDDAGPNDFDAGQGPDPDAGQTGAPDAGQTADGGPMDGGPADAGAPDAGPVDSGTPGIFGYIFFDHAAIGTQTSVYYSVGFYPTQPTTWTCGPTLGTCCVAPPGTIQGGNGPDVNAGTVTFGDRTAGVTFSPALTLQGANYGSASGIPNSLPAGDVATVAASGSVVHPFALSSVAPQQILVSSPNWLLGSGATLPVGRDIPIVWAPETGGPANLTVEVNFEAISHNYGLGTVFCLVSDSAGGVTVPWALVGPADAGDSWQGYVRRTNKSFGGPAANPDNALIEFNVTTTLLGGGTFQ